MHGPLNPQRSNVTFQFTSYNHAYQQYLRQGVCEPD